MSKVTILVADAQGGGLGRQLVEQIKAGYPEATVIAVGTNSMATASMLKAKPDHVATGENAIVVNSRLADIIVCPIGMAIVDSLYGEVTLNMASAIARSKAQRIFIPFENCRNLVVGSRGQKLTDLIQEAVARIAEYL